MSLYDKNAQPLRGASDIFFFLSLSLKMSPSTLPGDKRPDYQASFSPVKERRSAKEVAGAAEKASQSAVGTSVEGGGGTKEI